MIDDEFEVWLELLLLLYSRACKTPHVEGVNTGLPTIPISRGCKTKIAGYG
jgi:hypothetical protein